MIPTSKYKKLLGAALEDLSDEEVEQLKKTHYMLAHVLFDFYID